MRTIRGTASDPAAALEKAAALESDSMPLEEIAAVRIPSPVDDGRAAQQATADAQFDS